MLVRVTDLSVHVLILRSLEESMDSLSFFFVLKLLKKRGEHNPILHYYIHAKIFLSKAGQLHFELMESPV